MYASIYVHTYILPHDMKFSHQSYTTLTLLKSPTYMEVVIKTRFLLEKSKQIFTVFCKQIDLGLVTKQTMGTTHL